MYIDYIKCLHHMDYSEQAFMNSLDKPQEALNLVTSGEPHGCSKSQNHKQNIP